MLTNIGESFGFVFKDPRWFPKVAMGALFVLLSAVFVGIPFLMGYMVWVTRNVIRREPYPLPEWTHLGEMFVTGLKLLVCYIFFILPLWVLLMIPVFLICWSSLQRFSVAGMMSGVIIYLIAILASIVYSVFWPAVYLRFAMTDQIGETFSIGEIWRFTKKNIYSVLLVIVLSWVAAMIGGAGAFVFLIGAFFTYPYALMIVAHLMGKLQLEENK
jgi:hypothetical protein